MRDPNRIPLVLKQVEEIWRQHPDLRLGQLLLAAMNPIYAGHDLFYVEDERLLDALRQKLG